jgi:dTDP-4-amino-4,6-dideoxygalactose transaminase
MNVALPHVPEYCDPAWHLFHILLDSYEERDDLMGFLNRKGIGATFHYIPLHSSPMGLQVGRSSDNCPVASDASKRLLRLPFFTGLEEGDQERVIKAILEWK